MKATRTADLSYGFQREDANTPKICNFMGKYMMKASQKHTMDWIECCGDDVGEQKSRRITYEDALRYKTIVIGKNKIDYMRANGKGVVFFDLTDGLYAIRYERELFDTFRVEEEFQRGERADCYDKPSAVTHIPTHLLIKV